MPFAHLHPIMSDARFTVAQGGLLESRSSDPDRLLAAGRLEVLRITKRVSAKPRSWVFAGTAGRNGSSARRVAISVGEGAPAARFDQESRTIHLSYPDQSHPDVQALLNQRRTRYCYFWSSPRGDRSHAWVITSP